MHLEEGLLGLTPVYRGSRVSNRHKEQELRDSTLPPITRRLRTQGRDTAHLALSQDPEEVSSHEEVEKAEPLTKVLNSDAPGEWLKTKFFFERENSIQN